MSRFPQSRPAEALPRTGSGAARRTAPDSGGSPAPSRLRGRWVVGDDGRLRMRWDVARGDGSGTA